MSKQTNAFESIMVTIEIPAMHPPIKYEMDKKANQLIVDRFLTTSMHYPCNYGFIPNTLGEDGDPLDVLVVTPIPLMSGTGILVRVIGVFNMEDEHGKDEKIIAVPDNSVTTSYRKIEAPDELPDDINKKIEHFFMHYKDLENKGWSKVLGWGDKSEALGVVHAAYLRFNDQ